MPSDTTIDAQRVQLCLLRAKSPAERGALALRLTAEVAGCSKRAIARVHPEYTPRQIGQRFVELHYGRELAAEFKQHAEGEATMGDANELVQALGPVLHELSRLGVRYYVGGSVASSVHGASRSTLDVDLAAEIDEAAAQALVAALQNEYYVSQEAVVEAVRRRSCFNLIHLVTSFKVDVFVSRGREFDRQAQDRAVVEMIGETNPLPARIATAEDILLIKLEWFRLGNETSERQWNDIIAVARLQGDRLDREYLSRWANELAVADLLQRLFAEVDLDRF